jgi:hypothetical protein
MRDAMIVEFLDALADLQNTLETLLLVHLVVLAEIERIPG